MYIRIKIILIKLIVIESLDSLVRPFSVLNVKKHTLQDSINVNINVICVVRVIVIVLELILVRKLLIGKIVKNVLDGFLLINVFKIIKSPLVKLAPPVIPFGNVLIVRKIFSGKTIHQKLIYAELKNVKIAVRNIQENINVI